MVDKSVDQKLDRLVGAVGENELFGRDVEVARDGFFGGGVLRVDGEVEQPTVFSLKSRRSFPARPPEGGE